ncbi:MAG TPA: glycosyltransferase [Acidimicrobiales bacterium]|nr:glycosyltransferase [Acidimicrobiales bacterium]
MELPSTLAIAAEALRWSVGPLLLSRLSPLPAARSDSEVIDVAVVIPARDEADNLPPLLQTLDDQRPRAAEVVVVDDASTDNTLSAAGAGGARVIPAGDFSRDWLGKPHACAKGAELTASGTLVFLDADVRLANDDVLGRLAAIVDENQDALVTVQPRHATVRPYEALGAFFVLVSLMGTNAFSFAGRRLKPVAAFGPCLATTRRTYSAVGGHSADEVRGSVIDDVALAGRYRAQKRPVIAFAGRDDVVYRMYPGGARDLIDGWTKNIAAGAAAARPVVLALIVLWLSGCITAGWRVIASPSFPSATVYAAYAVSIGILLRRVGRFPRFTATLYPIPLAIFLIVFVRATTLRALGRPVRWKARKVGGRGQR